MLPEIRCTAVLVACFVGVALGETCHQRDSVPPEYVAASYYPTPHGGWTPDWADSYAKAKNLVGRMTLAEKTNITAGTGIYMGKLSTRRAPDASRAPYPITNSNQGKLQRRNPSAIAAVADRESQSMCRKYRERPQTELPAVVSPG